VGTSDTALVPHRTIIIGRKGAVGEAHLAEHGCWPIDTTFYTSSRSSVDIDLKYLLHFLRSRNLGRLAITSTIPGLNRDTLRSQLVPVPPLPEQEGIVRLLDAADELRRLRAQADHHTADLIPALFHNMFGDPTTNPLRIPFGELDDFLSFVTSGSRGWADYYVQEGSRFIRSLDVRMNNISDDDAVFVKPPSGAEADRTRVKPGDVLLTITGSRIGRVAPVPERLNRAFISQHVAILRLKAGLIPEFISVFLSLDVGGQREIARAHYGQTKPGLNLTQIRKFRVPVPPIGQQEMFAARVAEIRALEARQAESRRRLDDLFQSLLHRAFRGEL
jgi:type I restriction enzyme, S subunit